MITSAAEFARLRISSDLDEQTRATHEAMVDDAQWQEVLTQFPDLTIWVIRNKTVPLTVLQKLAHDADPRIRREVACKRKLDEATIALLEDDMDISVANQMLQTKRQKGRAKC